MNPSRPPQPAHSQAQLDAAVAHLAARWTQHPDFSPHIQHVLEQQGVLGEGGMGRVLRVRDKRLGREVALKILQPSQGDMDAILRFKREAQIMARLDHPGIPPVYESGMTPEGQPFLLMKIVQGVTLTERIAKYHEEGCPEDERDELLRALIKVSEAVAYGHSRGVIHRDLKPDNIMIGQYGEVLVMDWGLAKLIKEKDDPRLTRPSLVLSKLEAQELGATQEGTILGTPGYMSPEQVNARELTAASEVFALSAILGRLLSNQSVIAGASVFEILSNTIKGRRRRVSELKAGIPRVLGDIVERGMALSVRERTPTAADFAAQLRSFLERREAPRSLKWPVVFVGLLILMSLVFEFWRRGLKDDQQRVVAGLSEQLKRRDELIEDFKKQSRPARPGAVTSEALNAWLKKRQELSLEHDFKRARVLIEDIVATWPSRDEGGHEAYWWAFEQLSKWRNGIVLRAHLLTMKDKWPGDLRVQFELAWLNALETSQPLLTLRSRLKDLGTARDCLPEHRCYLDFVELLKNHSGATNELEE